MPTLVCVADPAHVATFADGTLVKGEPIEKWFVGVGRLCSKCRLARAVRRREVAEAERQRDAGIAAAEEHADAGWTDDAYDTLVDYLTTHREFFVDDFWAETSLRRPHESRALGAVVQRAARAKLMVKSGRFRPSVASNMTEKPVWTSLVYQ